MIDGGHLNKIMIPILTWSLLQVTIVTGQAPQNQQLPDGKLCLFTCSEWIFEEKVLQFAPSANLLGPGQLNKHTIGLPSSRNTDSQTSSNNFNYYNVWGAVYIINKNEYEAVIKQSQAEYETPFISNEEVIVVNYGGMNCLAVDLGIQPGDHPPRHHPSHILPNANQDKPYYDRLMQLGVPQDYINGLQLASQKPQHRSVIPRDYHPVRNNRQTNPVMDNQPSKSDVDNGVVDSPTQGSYPDQPFVVITPLELPDNENNKQNPAQLSSSLIPEKNVQKMPSQVINNTPDQSTPVITPQSVQSTPSLTPVQPLGPVPITSTRDIPPQVDSQSPAKLKPVTSQNPIIPAPSSTGGRPNLITATPRNTPSQVSKSPSNQLTSTTPQKPEINSSQPRVIIQPSNTQNISPPVSNESPIPIAKKPVESLPTTTELPQPSDINRQPVDNNDHSTEEVNQPFVVITPLKLPQSDNELAAAPLTSTQPQKPIVQSPTSIHSHRIPVSRIPNDVSSTQPSVPSSSIPTSKVPVKFGTETPDHYSPSLQTDQPQVVITPLKNPGTVPTPIDESKDQPHLLTQSPKPQPNNLPKSGVLGFPKPDNSQNLPTSQTPLVQGPVTGSKSPTVLINPNHQVTGSGDDSKSPTVLISPNQSPRPSTRSVGVNPLSPACDENSFTPSHSDDDVTLPDNQTPLVLISPNRSQPVQHGRQYTSPERIPTTPQPHVALPAETSPSTPPHLPLSFTTTDNPPVLPDTPLFVPNNNQHSTPSLPPSFATTDTPPLLPDRPMFMPQDNDSIHPVPSSFDTRDIPSQLPNNNNPKHPLPSSFDTRDIPSQLPNQPMFIPKRNSSPRLPSHFVTEEKPSESPDRHMFVPDNTIQLNNPNQQAKPSTPVSTPSQPHATGYIPKSTLDQKSHPQQNEDLPSIQYSPQAIGLKPKSLDNKNPIPLTVGVPPNSLNQPHATGLKPKPIDHQDSYPIQTLQPATPVQLQQPLSTNISPTLTTTDQPHATGLLPKPTDDQNYHPVRPVKPATPVQLQQLPSNNVTPTLTTSNHPHATGLLPKPTDDQNYHPVRPLKPATPVQLQQLPSNNVTPTLTTPNQPHATGLLPKPADDHPVQTLQTDTPVQLQQQPSNKVTPSTSQFHATGLLPKLADDERNKPTKPLQPSAAPSSPKSIYDQNNPVQPEKQISPTVPQGTTQSNQNGNPPNNYNPSTFMVPNYTPDSPVLGYTFGTRYPQFIQRYNPHYVPSNRVFSPEEFFPGLTFGGHCQLF